MNIILILCLTALISVGSAKKYRFDNFTLYKVLPENEQQIVYLSNLRNNNLNYDFWSEIVPKAEYVNVMVSPVDKAEFEIGLLNSDIKFQITISNVQEAIDKETVSTYNRNSRSMRWDMYYKLEDIEAWMSDMATEYSSVATEIIGGISYEGRPIKGLKISHGTGKRIIFIESGIHSREWITMTTTCFIINELLTSDNEETKAAARDFDWYIFPVTNPDGYVWTHEEFRLWRKNRRPVGTEFGIDLNRNWNSNWLQESVNINPASNNYPGLGPFSEPETRTLSAFIRPLAKDMDLYISFHSSGQLMMVPFGNTTDPLDNYYDAVNIGRRAMGALSVRHNTRYNTGNIAETIYFATGTSIDWVKEHLHVPLVYCYELRDQGTYGHLLPPEQILPNNLEVMDSVLDLIHQAKRFGYMNSANGIFGSWCIMMIAFLKYIIF